MTAFCCAARKLLHHSACRLCGTLDRVSTGTARTHSAVSSASASSQADHMDCHNRQREAGVIRASPVGALAGIGSAGALPGIGPAGALAGTGSAGALAGIGSAGARSMASKEMGRAGSAPPGQARHPWHLSQARLPRQLSALELPAQHSLILGKRPQQHRPNCLAPALSALLVCVCGWCVQVQKETAVVVKARRNGGCAADLERKGAAGARQGEEAQVTVSEEGGGSLLSCRLFLLWTASSSDGEPRSGCLPLSPSSPAHSPASSCPCPAPLLLIQVRQSGKRRGMPASRLEGGGREGGRREIRGSTSMCNGTECLKGRKDGLQPIPAFKAEGGKRACKGRHNISKAERQHNR